MPIFKPAAKSKGKIFCIGQNKTGTSSLEVALANLGYKPGNQEKGEKLLKDWATRDFRKIVKLCKTGDFFQDVPFSNDYTYIAMDCSFPGSKFILTIRDNKNQWYESLTRFHTRVIGKDRLPTPRDLKEHRYRDKEFFRGYLWDAQVLKYGIDESTLYDYEIYTAKYELHNSQVLEYFRYRQDDLLVLNVAKPKSMERLFNFLGHPFNGEIMPHINASR
jgi:hypothetical protein